MNFAKNPRLAKRLAQRQKKVAQLARQGREVKGKELLDWDLHLENYDYEGEREHRQHLREERRGTAHDVP